MPNLKKDRAVRLAWGVGAWSLLVPVLGAAWLAGGFDPSVFVTILVVLVGGVIGKFVAFPIVLGSVAWWAIRAVVAVLRVTEVPSLGDAIQPTRRHAALAVVIATPLVLLLGATGGALSSIGTGVSGGAVLGFAAFAWLGLVGPSLAAALGWLPAEAAFIVLLVAWLGPAEDDGSDGEPVREPREQPVAVAVPARSGAAGEQPGTTPPKRG